MLLERVQSQMRLLLPMIVPKLTNGLNARARVVPHGCETISYVGVTFWDPRNLTNWTKKNARWQRGPSPKKQQQMVPTYGTHYCARITLNHYFRGSIHRAVVVLCIVANPVS